MTSGDAAFAGSIPALYDRYLGPLLFEPYAADLASRLSDLRSGALLETAAGTGIVTQALAQGLPAEIELVATDLNQAMLDFAASKPGVASTSARPTRSPCLSRPIASMRSCASSGRCSFPIAWRATAKRGGS